PRNGSRSPCPGSASPRAWLLNTRKLDKGHDPSVYSGEVERIGGGARDWRITETTMAKRTVSNTHEDFTPGSLDVILPTSCRSSKTVAQRHGVTFAFGNTN